MTRLKINHILIGLTLISNVASEKATFDTTDPSLDVSTADESDYHPAIQLGWSHTKTLTSRSIENELHSQPLPSGIDTSVEASTSITRQRRDLGPEGRLEQIAGSKNVREARMLGTPETWSKQPLAVQFRPRHPPPPLDHYDEDGDIDEAANLPPLIRAHYAPKTDFVTSGRGRALPLDGRPQPPPPPPPEARESREMPIARSYDEYDVPIFRNIVREHDFDVQIPRNYYYPNRYRSQRDYYYRGSGGGGGGGIGPPSPYIYDRYRDEDEDYELYNRYSRPSTPKPKRIIYYATLPEIVRKPVDLRTYQRPYDPLLRGSETPQPLDADRVKPTSNVEPTPTRRPLRYPYDNYDNYVKRSSYYDRRRPVYLTGDDDRLRDPDRARANYKEKIRSEDRKSDSSQLARSENDRRLPWPVQIGTEVSVKDSERISGRKIFGQLENYNRYDGPRIKKDNAERKEDTNQDNKSNSGSSDINNN